MLCLRSWHFQVTFLSTTFVNFPFSNYVYVCILQVSLNGGLHPVSPFQKDFEARYVVEYRGFLGLSNAMHFQRDSVKAHATKSFYSNVVKSTEQSVPMDFVNTSSCSNESDYLNCKYSDAWHSSGGTVDYQHPLGRFKLKYVESSSLLTTDEGLVDLTDQSTENASTLFRAVEPETISATDLTQGNSTSVSDSLDINNDQLASVKPSIEDLIDGVSKSFSASVDKGENAVKSSLDTITSSISSVVERVNEGVDDAVSGIFSTVDQTGQLGATKLTNFSSDFKEATSKGSVIAVDVLRRTIVVVEDSLANGASFAVNSYQSSKAFLPPDISAALNLSEKRAAEFLGPAKAAFEQVSLFLGTAN